MKIALLGYGKEGQAIEAYFKQHDQNATFDIFENETPESLSQRDYSSYDIIFRSPSVPPFVPKANSAAHRPELSSATKYFFAHCPCPIIGVTGTKGKGTTCSLIAAILKSLQKSVYLVGNIGLPAINVLDNLTKNDIVVFEMSSFQLWDLSKSPDVAVVLRIEPDHLNVHHGFADYVDAKSHIAKFQTPDNALVYFKDNAESTKIAKSSPARRQFSYPLAQKSAQMAELLDSLTVPGAHNKENAEAALLAVSALLNISPDELISHHFSELKSAFKSFQGLPHHLEFVRSFHGVDYYDDSFSASYPSLEVALKAFPGREIILIAGGFDRGLDLKPAKTAIFSAPNIQKALLIGETKTKLAQGEDSTKFMLFDDFHAAIEEAQAIAEDIAAKTNASTSDNCANSARPIVLLSPGAPSFDMFKDFYDRGDQFKAIVQELK